MTTAHDLITAERRRQIEDEGWTPAHDDEHRGFHLGRAADCYRRNALGDALPRTAEGVPTQWPWADEWWKPCDPVRDLTKAGALYEAEIERLTRLRDECAAAIERSLTT
jgi:hypothetical protein